MATHIIELYGLPGVGKSTYARELMKQGYVSVPKTKNRWGYGALLVRYPRVVAEWLVLVAANSWQARSIKILHYDLAVFFASLQQIDAAKRLPADKVVLEEALVQRFLSLSYVLHSPKRVEKLLQLTPIGDALIHVNHRAVERTRYKQTHPRKQVSESSFKLWEAQLQRNLETVCLVLKDVEQYNDTATL